jgi:hypothetical protein
MRYEQEVDTKLAALLEAHVRVERDLDHAEWTLHTVAGDRKRPDPTRPKVDVWGLTDREAIAKLTADPKLWARGITASEALKEWNAAVLAYRASQAAIEAQEALYTGWSRFFLVLNPDGHIHSSRSCSTCVWTTRFGWLPDVSGLTEVEAVAAHGKRLCTVCFPSAPTDWCEGYRDQTKVAVEARRTARQEARDAKEAKKAAYWADRHFGVRHTRSDGSVWTSGCDNEWEVERKGARPKGLTLKAALREAKEYNGPAVAVDLGAAVAVDLLTGEVVDG